VSSIAMCAQIVDRSQLLCQLMPFGNLSNLKHSFLWYLLDILDLAGFLILSMLSMIWYIFCSFTLGGNAEIVAVLQRPYSAAAFRNKKATCFLYLSWVLICRFTKIFFSKTWRQIVPGADAVLKILHGNQTPEICTTA
jgi:hypothetical protein